jgi:recyclin-1
MEKFETLQPTRLYAPDVKASKPRNATIAPIQFVGRLPIDLHILVLVHLPIPDFPAYARCSHSLSNLSRHEKVWEVKWNALRFAKHAHFQHLLDQLEDAKKTKDGGLMKNMPPTLAVGDVDDEFGDFAQPQVPTTAGFMVVEEDKSQLYASVSSMRSPTHLDLYRRVHHLLKPYTTSLSFPPHAILAYLFPSVPGIPPVPLLQQSSILHLLLLWLSPQIQPLLKWGAFNVSLRSAIDRHEANLLAAFDIAESRKDEKGMTEAAEASWEVFDGPGEWELGRVWAEKREIFYEAEKWNPMANLTCVHHPFNQRALTIMPFEVNNPSLRSMLWTNS